MYTYTTTYILYSLHQFHSLKFYLGLIFTFIRHRVGPQIVP